MRRSRGRPRHPDLLTPAEWEVADLVRHGLSRREIAQRRGTSLDAVKYHLINIGSKIGVAGMAELRSWPGVPRRSPLHPRTRNGDLVTSPTELTSIGQLSLLITDVATAERFYRDVLGLDHLYTYGDLAFFDCGGTRLFLRAVPTTEWTAGSIIYFTVADIGATHQRLRDAGARFEGAPHMIHRHADGTEEWMAFFADPAGNLLAIMSQVLPLA